MSYSAYRELVQLLKELRVEDIKKLEENFDEQFIALKYLYKNITDKESFPILVILNALVSYQLNTTGEEYWWEFSKYFSKREIKDEIYSMITFLRNSKGNRRFLNSKIKRLEKIKNHIKNIKENYNNFYNDMVKLRDFLVSIMKQDKNAKTIVFSVKMFGYAMRIYSEKFIPYPFDIAIPIDSRIKKITIKFTKQDPVSFWYKVSKETKIPPLHIDSVIWTLYRKDAGKLKYMLPEKYEVLRKIREIVI